MKIPRILITSFLLAVTPLSFATDAVHQKEAELTKIKQDIHSIEHAITEDKSKQNELSNELKAIETDIGQLSNQTQSLSQQWNRQKERLNKLQDMKSHSMAELKESQKILNQLLRANYMLERQGEYTLYFSPEEANTKQRYLAYYRALDQAQLHAITTSNTLIDELSNTMHAINEGNAHLHALYEQIDQQQKAVEKKQAERQAILTQLHHSIVSKSKQLDTLQNNQKVLTQLIDTLKHQQAQTSLRFSSMKGKLNWPVNGQLSAHFHSSMKVGSLTWQGDLINAPANTSVHAIYSGNVVYSGWLKGYGLLLIIDHGDGYMSLYARNHSLTRNTGDKVTTGDIIATVGQSGGFSEPALYFEIRHNGNVDNPELWLKKRNS